MQMFMNLENAADAEAVAAPQVPPVHLTSSEDEDYPIVSERLNQLQRKVKRPLSPTEGDEDEHLRKKIHQLRRGLAQDTIRSDEDEADEESIFDRCKHGSPNDIQNEVSGSCHSNHMADPSKATFGEANLPSVLKLLAPTSKDDSADQIMLSAYLKGKNDALNHRNQNLQNELEIVCKTHKSQLGNISAELEKKNEENMAQEQLSRIMQELQQQKGENAILQDSIMPQKEVFRRKAITTRDLREKVEELKKTNEEYMILIAQIPRLKEDLQRGEIIRSENESKIQGLKEEIKNIKNDKRLIVQLNENQLNNITDLISQKVQGTSSNVTR